MATAIEGPHRMSLEHPAYNAESNPDEQNADLRVLKVMVQALVWNFIGSDSDPLDVLSHLKNEVMTSLYKSMSLPPEGQGGEEAERLRRVTLIRGEKMFREIERIMVAEHQNRASGGR